MSKSVDWKRAAVELVVIILGVLIALAADRWNQGRLERSAADDYVGRLIAALEADLVEYQTASQAAALVDSSTQYVLAVYRGRDVSPDEQQHFIRSVLFSSFAPLPLVAADTYEDLVATGNLGLLEPVRRAGVTQYYGGVALYEERDAVFRDVASRGYWLTVHDILGPDLLPLTWEVLRSGQGPESGEWFDAIPETVPVTDAQIQGAVDRLRAADDVERGVASIRYHQVQRRVIYGERMSEAARELLDVLRAN